MTTRTLPERGLDPLASLAWLQLHDSAFPAGRFVHSYGLEAWLARHPDAGEVEVGAVCRSYLAGSAAPVDATAMAAAWLRAGVPDPWDALVGLDRLLGTHKLTAGARAASAGPGRQLAATAARVYPRMAADPYLRAVLARDAPGHVAVVEAVVCRHLEVPVTHGVLGHLRSTHAGLLSAAVRLGRAAPMWAQRRLADDALLLLDLATTVVRAAAVADEAGELPVLRSSTPELEICAMRHERTSARLFST